MSGIAYDALPVEQKRQIARELRPSTTLRDLAAMLRVSYRKINEWTAGIDVDLRVTRVPKRILTDEDYCQCASPFTDSRMNSYCKRTETCVKCGRPSR